MASSIRRGTLKRGTVGWEVRGKIYKTRDEAKKTETRVRPEARPVAVRRALAVKEEPAEELKPGEVITEKPPEGMLLKNAGTWNSLSQTSHETRNIFKCRDYQKQNFLLF